MYAIIILTSGSQKAVGPFVTLGQVLAYVRKVLNKCQQVGEDQTPVEDVLKTIEEELKAQGWSNPYYESIGGYIDMEVWALGHPSLEKL